MMRPLAIALLLTAARLQAQEAPPAGGPPGLPRGVVLDPAAARISTLDVERFSAALEKLGGARDTAALLDSLYFAAGSAGLQAYSRLYGLDGAVLSRAIAGRPDLYRRVAVDAPRTIAAQEPRVREAFARLREQYPPAVFPPVWFLVGGARAGGAVQPEGVLIAVEVYTPAGDEAEDSLANDLDDLVHLVAHELVHYQQAAADLEGYMREPTLLGRAVREGVADFVAERASGAHINRRAHAWAREREAEVWDAFRAEMDGTATGGWFFTKPARAGWPQDLGYVVGYWIAQAYADRHPETAIPDLIRRTTDPEALLEASGYGAVSEARD